MMALLLHDVATQQGTATWERRVALAERRPAPRSTDRHRGTLLDALRGILAGLSNPRSAVRGHQEGRDHPGAEGMHDMTIRDQQERTTGSAARSARRPTAEAS